MTTVLYFGIVQRTWDWSEEISLRHGFPAELCKFHIFCPTSDFSVSQLPHLHREDCCEEEVTTKLYDQSCILRVEKESIPSK